MRTSKSFAAFRTRCTTSRKLAVTVWNELYRTHAFDNAAGLAFFSLLSLIPLLIVMGSLMSYLPIPHLFQQLLHLMATLVPRDSFSMVEKIVAGFLTPGHTRILSLGILGYLWSSTGAFTSLITALDIAYDVEASRPWWRDRLQALLLAFTSGGLILISLLVLVAGPHFGHFLAAIFPLPRSLGRLWPGLRMLITVITFLAALELVYFLGPNTRQSFFETLPGAALAIGVWFPGSVGLTFYLDHFTHYNIAYGSLGAVISLMLWLYITSLAVLTGAELNAERRKQLCLPRRPLP
ncbi:YihY/virulence factor BrkB family protein [Paracidobacterium acidisoli]|nr:YihY/virulence factor BrkB family protein [Paracidobacterium acidisoli]MBT9332907.1 YihY/virulence factor BrkB family protein [Paracidobacterium acidisoli]